MAKRPVDRGAVKELLLSWLTFNNAYRIVGLVFIILGLSFYVGWSILYNTWADSGLYSVTVMFVVFGLLALLLAGEKKKDEKSRK